MEFRLAILVLSLSLVVKCELNDFEDKAAVMEDIELSLMLIGRTLDEKLIDKVINEATLNTAHKLPKPDKILVTYADELRTLVVGEPSDVTQKNFVLVKSALAEIRSRVKGVSPTNATQINQFREGVLPIIQETVKGIQF